MDLVDKYLNEAKGDFKYKGKEYNIYQLSKDFLNPDFSLDQMDAQAWYLDNYIKKHKDWTSIGIGFYEHKKYRSKEGADWSVWIDANATGNVRIFLSKLTGEKTKGGQLKTETWGDEFADTPEAIEKTIKKFEKKMKTGRRW